MPTLPQIARTDNTAADPPPLCLDCVAAPAALNRGLCAGCEARRELVRLSERIARAGSDRQALGVCDLLATAIGNAELFDDPDCLRFLEMGFGLAAEQHNLNHPRRPFGHPTWEQVAAVRVVRDPRPTRPGEELEPDDD